MGLSLALQVSYFVIVPLQSKCGKMGSIFYCAKNLSALGKLQAFGTL
jgi:hypothetical protein